MSIKISRLKGHVLFTALVISIIIVVIISSLFVVLLQSKVVWTTSQKNDRLDRNLLSAINIVLADSSKPSESNLFIDLFEDGSDSVSILRSHWGAYNFASVKSFNSLQVRTASFLFGALLEEQFPFGIYLVDHNRPLQISGNTTIAGDAYLPPSGIRKTEVEGKKYLKDKLVFGDVRLSDTSAYYNDASTVNHLEYLLDINRFRNEPFYEKIPDSVRNDFTNETKIFFTSGHFEINSNLNGRIIIVADSLIRVKAKAKINDVIVIAPEILIEDGFDGSMQLIASSKIVIGKNCRIRYPGSAILISNSEQEQGSVTLGEGSLVSGVLFAKSNTVNMPVVILKPQSVVEGLCFVRGFLQHSGSVYGSVITDYFLYKSDYATYENTITDAVIDRSKLSEYFVGSPIVTKPDRKKIIKWLK